MPPSPENATSTLVLVLSNFFHSLGSETDTTNEGAAFLDWASKGNNANSKSNGG